MSHQLYNIATPSVHMIPGGLHNGKQIIIRGRMQDGGDSFSINFQQEQWDEGPIAFHFNPRHSERIIVRNSKRDNWENEERDDVYYYPFGDNQEFSVRILVTESEYKVYGDGYHVLDFAHRHPYQDVNYIRVDGDCYIYDMAFQDRLQPPYVGRIPGNFQVGKAVRIRGVVKDGSEGSFSVNLQCDHSGDDVAFHFNARANEGEVVRNSLLGGEWGAEEREADQYPFPINSFFDMFCVATEDAFAIYVNGEFFANFGYRTAVEQVSHLGIKGDVEIADVQYFDQTRENVCKEIPSGLKKGDTIMVRGVFNPDGETFSINLLHELDPSSDRAFHFNPRRSEGEVVLNSCYGGEWGEEVRQDLPWMFRHSLPFDLRLVAKRNKIKVYVNGEYISKFEARNPILDVVKSVSMEGDAFIHQIKLQREVKPPHIERLPGLITDNQWISFTGTIKKDCEQFSVNLLCGPNEDSDIALHLNPRLSSEVVVRNSFQGGEWHSEETEQPHFPFQHKDFFEVVLCVKPEVIKIYVNGKYFVDFHHRVPYEMISHVKTAGDANFFQPEYF